MIWRSSFIAFIVLKSYWLTQKKYLLTEEPFASFLIDAYWPWFSSCSILSCWLAKPGEMSSFRLFLFKFLVSYSWSRSDGRLSGFKTSDGVSSAFEKTWLVIDLKSMLLPTAEFPLPLYLPLLSSIETAAPIALFLFSFWELPPPWPAIVLEAARVDLDLFFAKGVNS